MKAIFTIFALGTVLILNGHATTDDGHTNVDPGARDASNPLKRTYSCINVFNDQRPGQRSDQPLCNYHRLEKTEHTFMIFFQQCNPRDFDERPEKYIKQSDNFMPQEEKESKRRKLNDKQSEEKSSRRKIKLKNSPGFKSRLTSSRHKKTSEPSNQLMFPLKKQSLNDEHSALEKICFNVTGYSNISVSSLSEKMEHLNVTPTPQNSPAPTHGKLMSIETPPRSISATLSVPSIQFKIWEEDRL